MAMIDQNPLTAALRKRQDAKQLAEQGQQFQGMADLSMRRGFDIGGGSIQGMNGYQAPAPTAIDWGGILQSGVGNYMSAKSRKESKAAEVDADAINRQFMMDVLNDDPEAQRLMQMVQAGVPGAEDALSSRVAPKKQPVAMFTQFLSQNPEIDEAAAIELGAQSGLSAELSMGLVKAAKASRSEERQYAEGMKAEELGQRMILQDRRDQNALLRKMTPSTSVSLGRRGLAGADGGGAGRELTGLERGQRGKMMAEIDKELMAIGQSSGQFDELMNTIERDNTFGGQSKVAEFLAERENPLAAAVGKSQLSEGNLRLKNYVMSETLKRMAQLGGNDSNEELNRITGSLPSAMNDKTAAVAMLKQLHEWEETTRLAIKLRRDDIQTERWFATQGTPDDYYRMAKQIRAGGGSPAAPQQQAAPAYNFDAEFDEIFGQ